MRALRRIGRDLRNRRHIEAYVVAMVSTVLAIESLVGDVVGDDLRWATVLTALGVLTYHVTVPGPSADLDDVLHNRTSFDETTIGSRLRGAREFWVLGPSVINLLTADTADALRKTVLNRQDGVVRMIVLDPTATEAIRMATRQLDDATEYAAEVLPRAVQATADRLERMTGWSMAGRFEYRFMAFNPGFSMVAIDPHGKGGLLIVEFHGAHNESTASRMHIELTRAASEPWYLYWRDQFEHVWQDARPPDAPVPPDQPAPPEASVQETSA